MWPYFFRRLRRAIITIFAISLFVFVAARMTGDPVMHFAPEDASDEEIAQLRTDMGLDKPLLEQYGIYLTDVAKGDFGESLRYREPAFDMVLARLPATIKLALLAFIVSTALGVFLGVVAALKRGTWIDNSIRMFAVLGQSAPSFFVGVLAILLFSVHLHWLPTSGRMGPEFIILPAMTLALFSLASVLRLTRSSMLETSSSEYIKFLRSKGLPEGQIIWKHALRNAFVPVMAVLGIQLSHLVGGAVIIEIVFNWPGVGRLLVEALLNSDFPLIQAGVTLIAVCVVLTNLAIDLSFGLIDPRIRYE